MKNIQKNTCYSIGFLVIIFTIILYLLSTQNLFKYPMCWLALTFIVLSELYTTFLCSKIQKSPIRLAIALIGITQTCFTIIVSIFFINILVFGYIKFLISYIISFGLAIIIISVLTRFSNKRYQENECFKEAKKNILRCRDLVLQLINSDIGTPYFDILKQLDENLRFTDDSTTCDVDAVIYDKLNDLSIKLHSDATDIPKDVDAINALITHRNFIVKNEKAYK